MTQLSRSRKLTLVLLISGAFIEDPVRRAGFFLAPVAVVVASITAFFAALYSARRRFGVVAKVSLARSVLGAIATLLGVLAIGPYAVFLMPVLADLMSVVIYATRRPSLGLGFRFDLGAARPLLRSGFPMGAAAVVYWVYRLVGSTSVALASGPTAFGLYSFAAAPIVLLTRALASVHTVSMPAVWGGMAAERDRTWVREGERLTLALAVAAAIVANLGQAGFAPLANLVAPQFKEGIPIFNVLAFNVFLLSIAAFPALVLDSSLVNKQTQHLSIWIAAVGVNAIANAAVLAAGWGPMAVAWNDIWVQGVVVIAIFWAAARYVGQDLRRLYTYGLVLLTAAFMTINALVLHVTSTARVTGIADSIMQAGIRAGAVLIAWTLALLAFRSLRRSRTR